MMKIPITKPYIGEEEARAARETIMGGWVTQGPKVQEFEQRFAEYAGSKYAVAVSSCTTALHLAMIVAGIKQGDEVICPSMSFIASANCITYIGARPVFAEINLATYNLDLRHVKTLVNKKTKAILLVHQMGMPGDIDAFESFCNEKNIILIEDAACAIGSKYKNKPIGSHSELVCFSFHPRKIITTGDGGMITTSNEEFYQRLKLLRQHGMSVSDQLRHESNKYITEEYLEIGYNYRMTDIQAAIGIEQFKKIDHIISIRRNIAELYRQKLCDIDCIRLPIEPEGYFTNYQSYSIYLKENSRVKRDDLIQRLLDKGIATRKGIMTAHREHAYINLYGELSLPKTEDASDNSILIPLYVTLKQEEIDYIISSFRENIFL